MSAPRSTRLPLVSVLMPVYNCAPFVDEAVQCILNQTFSDFEFLVVDDASTDDTWERLQKHTDPRIRLSRNAANRGCAANCNELLVAARGALIFRMDGDDLCEPSILERELALLRARPAVGAVSVWHTLIDTEGRRLAVAQLPLEWPEIRPRLFYCSGFLHAGGMYRTAILRSIGGWRPRVGIAEECDLYLRLGEVTEMVNIGEPLYHYRQHGGGSVRSVPHARMQAMRLVKVLAMERELFGDDTLAAMTDERLSAVRAGAIPAPQRPSRQGAQVMCAVARRLRQAGEPAEALRFVSYASRLWPFGAMAAAHAAAVLLSPASYARSCRRVRNTAGRLRRWLRMRM